MDINKPKPIDRWPQQAIPFTEDCTGCEATTCYEVVGGRLGGKCSDGISKAGASVTMDTNGCPPGEKDPS